MSRRALVVIAGLLLGCPRTRHVQVLPQAPVLLPAATCPRTDGPVVGPDFSQVVQRSAAAIANVSTTGGKRRSLGSGFVVNDRGHVLTHALPSDGPLTVELPGGRRHRATVVASDDSLDLAILKFDGAPSPHATFSSAVHDGEWVVAIGSPFAGTTASSAGRVARDGHLPQARSDAFAPGASINPGLRGGPLLNLAGDVVGISAYSQVATEPGMLRGFAIGVETATAFLKAYDIPFSLREEGAASRRASEVCARSLEMPSDLEQAVCVVRSTRRGETTVGLGTVVSARRYVITASFLVKDADQISVELSDGTKHAARVERLLPEDRGALLAIPAGEAPRRVACLGASRDIDEGAWLFAIGDPAGPRRSVGTGILSAKSRDFLQTDARTGKNDAGGPWFDLRGRMIGMTYAYFANGGAANITFAAPVDDLRSVLHESLRADPGDQGCGP